MTKIKINVNLSEMCNWRLTFWMSSRLWKRRVVILQVNKKIERAGGWWGRCWIWNQCIGISESSRLIKHNWHSLPNSVVTLHLSTLLCPSQLSLSRFSKSQLTLAKSYESFLSGISIKSKMHTYGIFIRLLDIFHLLYMMTHSKISEAKNTFDIPRGWHLLTNILNFPFFLCFFSPCVLPCSSVSSALPSAPSSSPLSLSFSPSAIHLHLCPDRHCHPH